MATGRGEGRHLDVAPGAGWYAPYTTDALKQEALESMASGATPIPFAEGWGISEAVAASDNTALNLVAPGWLTLQADDGLPAHVRVMFSAGDPVSADPRLVPGRPSGAVEAWIGSGTITLPIEPGSYSLIAHRGIRHEPHSEEFSISSGEAIDITLTLAESYDPGVPIIDHVADYRPLIAALSMDGVLESIVADEVSPVLRGHLNVYPLSEVIGEPNNGALRWWQEVRQTPELFAVIRDQVGEGFIQLNHPFDSGMLSAAGYHNGVVQDADYWSADFDAMEVINDGNHDESFEAYLDMTARDLDPIPTGVSDSHGYHGGVGESVTFLHTDGQAMSDDVLVEAMGARAVVVSTGPYLEITADGQWAPGRTFTGSVELEVAVWTSSWIPVDRLVLYVDGQRGEEIPVTGEAPERLRTTITLEPESDAVVVIVAESDGASHTVYTTSQPWAMAAAIRVDVDGDGWDSPLPSVSVD